MNFQKNTLIETILEWTSITLLFGVMLYFELYGAVLVSILFAGFVFFVGRSQKYKVVSNFIDSFFD